MNKYGATAKEHWRRWLPTRYRQLGDPTVFFSKLGEEIAEQVDELSRALAGNDPPGEQYMEKLGRLNMARFDAEAQVLRERALLDPEQEEEEQDEPGHEPVAAQIVNIRSPHTVYSPYSGLAADGESGPNTGDPTLLMIYYGMAADYAYADPRVRELVPPAGDLVAEEVAASLQIDGALLFVVDCGWDGVNFYAFAPAPERE